MKTRSPTKPKSLDKLALAAIEDLKGIDIRTLDVRALTTITDTMIICSGTSSRHVKSIADAVVVKAKDHGHQPRGVQGVEQGEWVVVDLGGVVVHVMQIGTRAFYQLEKLWDLQEQAKPAVAGAAR